MVILADELLERFFECGFAESFILLDEAAPSSSIYLHPNQPSHYQQQQPNQQQQHQHRQGGLTTFSSSYSNSTAGGAGSGPSTTTSLASANVIPSVLSNPAIASTAKGLRGVLDNIVNDGMRVAAEVKRRMDELDANARATGAKKDDDEEDEEDDAPVEGRDRELLSGAEAEVGSVRSGISGFGRGGDGVGEGEDDEGGQGSGAGSGVKVKKVVREGSTRGVVEFEGGVPGGDQR